MLSHVDPIVGAVKGIGWLAVTLPPECAREAEKRFAKGLCNLKQVGVVTEGKGVRLREEGKNRIFTEMACEEDELARMWELLAPRYSC